MDDVRPYLERATVFAAPLRFGAGVQNKLLEAMAMEVPIVASTLAVDGLRPETGEIPPVETADGRHQFSQHVIRALVARERDASADSRARRFVQDHFVWSQSVATFDEIIRRLVTANRQRSANPVTRIKWA